MTRDLPGKDRLERAYDHLMGLLDELEAYARELAAEAAERAGQQGIEHLLAAQRKRALGLVSDIGERADPLVRDLIDRLHVIEEAREGRFN